MRTRRLSAAELAARRAEAQPKPLRWGGSMTPAEVAALERAALSDSLREGARLDRERRARRVEVEGELE